MKKSVKITGIFCR